MEIARGVWCVTVPLEFGVAPIGDEIMRDDFAGWIWARVEYAEIDFQSRDVDLFRILRGAHDDALIEFIMSGFPKAGERFNALKQPPPAAERICALRWTEGGAAKTLITKQTVVTHVEMTDPPLLFDRLILRAFHIANWPCSPPQ
jgi:hypothetical protein